MFRTKYSQPVRFYAEAGSPILEIPIYDERGFIVDSDVSDLDAYIQSNRDNGNVALILDRYAVTGDDTLLNVANGFYGDVSRVQGSTLHDRHYNYQAAVDLYDSMPDGVKEMYPSVEEFYNNFNDDKIGSYFGLAMDTIDDIPLDTDGGDTVE